MEPSTLRAEREPIPQLKHFRKLLPNDPLPSNFEPLEAAKGDTKSVYETLERHHCDRETNSTNKARDEGLHLQLLPLKASPRRNIPKITTRSKSDDRVSRLSRRPGLYSPKPTLRHLSNRSIGAQEPWTLIKRVQRACTSYCCGWLLIVATILVLFIGALLLTLLLRHDYHFSQVRIQRNKFCFAFDSDA